MNASRNIWVVDFNKNSIEDLKEFIDPSKFKYANRVESANAVADYFRECNPQTEEEYDFFYETCDDYVYENAYCQKSPSCIRRKNQLIKVFKGNKIKKVLEVGAGIGSYALSLEQAGFKVSITESKDEAHRFAEWRFAKYGSEIQIVKQIEGQYDCIFFMDVIEHVCDPFSFLDKVCQHTNKILFVDGFGVHREDMGGYPQHFDFKINNYNYDINKFTPGKKPSIIKHLQSFGFGKMKLNVGPFPPKFFVRKKESVIFNFLKGMVR